jgi:hypothetical protein
MPAIKLRNVTGIFAYSDNIPPVIYIDYVVHAQSISLRSKSLICY